MVLEKILVFLNEYASAGSTYFISDWNKSLHKQCSNKSSLFIMYFFGSFGVQIRFIGYYSESLKKIYVTEAKFINDTLFTLGYGEQMAEWALIKLMHQVGQRWGFFGVYCTRNIHATHTVSYMKKIYSTYF